VRTLNGLEPEIREQLRILWTSDPYTPHALAAHPGVPADTVAAILAIMQQLNESEQGRQLLKGINFKGIAAAKDADWNDIRTLNLDLLDGLVTAQEESTTP
jgi:phosphonate transport system substrate-binding protein